jgi:hypothetical protein
MGSCPCCSARYSGQVRYCPACGYCPHYGSSPEACPGCGRPAFGPPMWSEPGHLPRPRAMGDDEFAFRAGLFLKWQELPASEFVANHLPVFADWLADRGSPEEAAARAEWKVYASRKQDPRAWWQWSVPVAGGWVRLIPLKNAAGEVADRVIEEGRAKLSAAHNARWLLCWPPGFVRFTGTLYHDPRRVRVTVQMSRSLLYSTPYEARFPAGYATLFHPFGTTLRPACVEPARPEPPSLFDFLEAPA